MNGQDSENKKNPETKKTLPAEGYKIKELGIFGSYLRAEEGKRSDVDLLIDFRKSPSFLEFMEIENYLADTLGMKVDLVMKSSLKPRIGKRILREVENPPLDPFEEMPVRSKELPLFFGGSRVRRTAFF